MAEDTLYIQIPKLLVQPVIENALKHGLEVKRGKGNIWISAFRTANRLEIAVEDDGVGISPTILKALNEKLAQGQAERLGSSTTSNIGLANINERIKLIYGTDYGVTVLSAEQQGTRVILSLGILS
ncbi:sensor histidine kinase [Flavonifractor sp. An91]|uniref:sensor histidine kinase n=1 Tax=Flavonifractor sp. An91 TaxID=1965665 RepID=UPI0013A66E5D|nr:ATP-binding protein [Flavonifractor sp. An91]